MPSTNLHAMQIAQIEVVEDVLVVGEKQTTEALCSSESQPLMVKRPEHVYFQVPELSSSADVKLLTVGIVYYRDRCVGIEVATFEYSKASQVPSLMGNGHRHFRANKLIRL